MKVDAEQGKVLVAGDVDPAKLINKLKRSGKHAEIWGGQKGVMMSNQNNPNINHQFQNLQVVDNSSKKGGKDKKVQKVVGGVQGQVAQFQNFKGVQAQDLKVPPKEHKAVKFSLPEEDFDGSDYGSDDGFEDNFGDYSEEEEEGYGDKHPVQNKKLLPVMGNVSGPHGPIMNAHKVNSGGPHGHSGMMNGPAINNHKGNGGGGGVGINYGGDHKKHDVINLAMQSKGKGGNSFEAKNGIKEGMKLKSNVDPRGVKDNKVEKQKKMNGKSEGGMLGRFLGIGKKSNKGESGGKLSKHESENVHNKGKEEKKGGGKLKGHGNNDMSKNDIDSEFGDYDHIPHHGKSGKGSNGNGNGNMGQMGINYPVDQMRNIAAAQGLPAVNGGGSGYYQGMQMQPPSYQQHQANIHPQDMMYNRPHPSMNNYMMPPPPMPSHPMSDPMTHTFSDENVESCSIM